MFDNLIKLKRGVIEEEKKSSDCEIHEEISQIKIISELDEAQMIEFFGV